MRIILKYILRSMFEKKIRFVLFVLSIAMSTALLMVSMGIVKIQLDTIKRSVTDVLEAHEIMIASNTGDDFFDLSGLDMVGIESVIPGIAMPSVVQNRDYESMMIHARDLDVLARYRFSQQLESADFTGPHIIISERVGIHLNLDVGDTLSVLMAGNPVDATVYGIVENRGLFYQDTAHQFNVLMPYDYVSESLGVEGLYNHVTAKQTLADADKSVALFNAHHDDFRAFLLYQEDIVIAGVRSQQMTFFMMLAFIMLVSTVILFGAFKLMMTERQRVIGTFFSQGATKRQMKTLLLGEGVLYGLFGGLVGACLGIAALYALHIFAAPLRAYGVIPPFVIDWPLAFLALGFAMVFALFACYVPVRAIKRYEVKELILGQSPAMPNVKKKKFIVGMGILMMAWIITTFTDTFAMSVSPALLILAMIGLVLVYPFVVSLLVRTLFPKLLPRVRLPALSMNNVRYSSSLRGNIAILMIALVSVITVVSVGKGIERIVSEAYTTLHFDIRVEQIRVNDRESREAIRTFLDNHAYVDAESISEIIYTHGHVNGAYAQIEAIEPDKFADLLTYIDFSDAGGSYLDLLADENNPYIIASTAAARRLGLSIGDIVALSINGVNQNYDVIGIVEAKLWNGGDTFFIHTTRMKEEFHLHSSILFFNTTIDSDEANAFFSAYFRDFGGRTMTHQEMEQMNTEQNRQMFELLNFFSLFAVVIGSFGAVNNMFISYLQRKKELAVMASLGATKRQISQMLLVESVFCVVLALSFILLYITMHMNIVSRLAQNIGFAVDIRFVFSDSALLLLMSGLIYLLATLPLVLRSRKLSIIEELKYE